jgi:hypothetical protein
MSRTSNPGFEEIQIAGTAKVTTRVAMLMSDGHVLPSPWKRLEHVNTTPIAAKFHEMIERNWEPNATAAGSLLK